MKSTGIGFNFPSAAGRIDSILDSSDYDYEDSDSIPSASDLTFMNGYYAKCCALFVDIRDSSSLPSKHRRPTLAKIYRSFISELVAVMNSDDKCREINIIGDSVWSAFNGQYKSDLKNAFNMAAKCSSVVKLLNYKLGKRGLTQLNVGVGIAWGRALVIKAGQSGSGINEIVYMGDVVNEAAKLGSFGNKTPLVDKQTLVSSDCYVNLDDHDQGLLAWNTSRGCWHGDIVNVAMDKWYVENCI